MGLDWCSDRDDFCSRDVLVSIVHLPCGLSLVCNRLRYVLSLLLLSPLLLHRSEYTVLSECKCILLTDLVWCWASGLILLALSQYNLRRSGRTKIPKVKQLLEGHREEILKGRGGAIRFSRGNQLKM